MDTVCRYSGNVMPEERLVSLVYLVCLVCLNQIDQTDQMNQLLQEERVPTWP